MGHSLVGIGGGVGPPRVLLFLRPPAWDVGHEDVLIVQGDKQKQKLLCSKQNGPKTII